MTQNFTHLQVVRFMLPVIHVGDRVSEGCLVPMSPTGSTRGFGLVPGRSGDPLAPKIR